MNSVINTLTASTRLEAILVAVTKDNSAWVIIAYRKTAMHAIFYINSINNIVIN